MRPILALLGGIATSLLGLVIVLGSSQDLVGALLIGSGALVAAAGRRPSASAPSS